jgi:uncharacterized membrane protein (Fun14 family)
MWDLASLGMLGATGFLVGYAVKKFVKLLLFLVGVFLLGLISLEHLGVIKIYYDKLDQVLVSSIGSVQRWSQEIMPTLSALSISLSFSVGFTLGLLKG